ncbi:DNA-binding protein [Roseovarius sp. S1116L3]|uniref:Replication region DNA-binding N-term n=1 Tax=Roseovarius nanhaiticus TaxID=573024 RepID=A0A1N7EV29_9RHOB|nr:DNA-binding protein [Roseovarius nanhaiticus]SEK66185.1 replication region DNA-binding N-term [Roseovarius nanhaiticus]SIR91933.1 replication region DNA-binding N-term [Roseovarius nanhaiticus]
MAQQLLTKKLFAETKSLLEKEGAKISAKTICDRAGVGSYTTATRLMSEMRAENEALLRAPDEVTDELSHLHDYVWTVAMSEATRSFEADRTLLERNRDEAEALSCERLDVIKQMETDAETQAERIAQLEERLRAAKVSITGLKRNAEEQRTRAETLQSVVASIAGENRTSSESTSRQASGESPADA